MRAAVLSNSFNTPPQFIMTDPLPMILIIGVGSIGEHHLRCFQQTGRVSVSICETNAKLRQSIASRYHVEQAFSDLDEALVQPFHAAVIATPASSHIPIALKAAQNGIHLLIEKPLSTSLESVDRLAALAEANQLAIARQRRERRKGAAGAEGPASSRDGDQSPRCLCSGGRL